VDGAGWFGRVRPAGRWGLLIALLWTPVSIADVLITGGVLTTFLLFCSGVIAGIYTMLLYLARPINPREIGERVSGAVFLLFVGFFHLAWAGILAAGVYDARSSLGELGPLVLVTGVGYAVLLGLLCLSSRVAALVLGGTAVATVMAAAGTTLGGGAVGVPGPLSLAIFAPIALLHATIGVAMFIDCSRRQRWWNELHSARACVGCGYSFDGLDGGPCPECGRPR
jgi:hypothetical protein